MIKERLSKLRKLMKENKIDMYFIPTDDDHMGEYVSSHFKSREFISGFTGSQGLVVVTDKEAGLWTDGRYFTQAEKQLKSSGITLYKQGLKGVVTFEEYIIKNIKNKGVLGFDGKTVNQAMMERLSKALDSKNASIRIDLDLVGQIWEDRPEMPSDKAFFLSDKYSGESTSSKLEKIKKDLEKEGADVLVFSVLEDIAWLFNIRGNDIHDTPVVYSYALVDKEKTVLYIDTNKFDKKMVKQLEKNEVFIKEYDDIVVDIAKYKNKKIFLDKAKLNSYVYKHIASGNTIINKVNPAGMYRAIKNKVQIKNLRNSHLKDGIAMTKFIYYVKNKIGKEEMSELSVQKYLHELRSQQEGFITDSFDTISAYKANAAMMHYSASEESNATLKDEGFLLVDSGGTYFDGTTDITRTIALGKLSEEEKLYYTLTLRGMLSLMRARFLYGTTGSNLDILARGPLWNIDVDYQCGTGHGVGYVLSVHEGPQSIRWGHPSVKVVLEEGMILTDEPGVYIPNKLGIRIENELLVTKGKANEYGQFMHFETLTYCPIDMDGLLVDLMTYEELETLNAYHQMVYEKISPFLKGKEKTWLKLATRKIKKSK